ncbi:MAG: PD-(D/E)XK nuclease family protein [Cyanobacteria bacterium P01_A01_bin.17]
MNQTPQNDEWRIAAESTGSIWQISQNHLSQFTRCQRKFQYRYLEQWGLPMVDTQRERQILGSQFHYLLQQQSMGLDIQPFLQENPPLQQWFDALQQSPPPSITGERQSEHQKTMVCEGFTLVAVYDLLIQNSQQAQILDWKTYTRPRDLKSLCRDWQTKLYPYLLVETTDYSPEQISMVYWFAQVRGKASHSLVLPYDSDRHQQTHQELVTMLRQLRHSLVGYEHGQPFSQAQIEDGQCDGRQHTCPFLVRCRGRSDVFVGGNDLDAIAEMPL